jgi:beta-lactamase superfamily II metal-dependent hydrolase
VFRYARLIGAEHLRRLSSTVLVAAAATFALFAGGSRLSAQQIATISLPAPGAAKTLYEGCNNIALTFPDRTPVGHPHPGWTTESVVDSIEPATALQSIWRYDAAQSRFLGFSSAAPQASDLLTVNFLDAVWVCVTASAAGPTQTPAPTSEPQAAGFSVHFIDVGQGDAILVETGDADILVDGGPSGSAVLPYLAGQNMPDIDLLVATHPHADHIGGLDGVLAQYDVREIWTNGASADTQTYHDFAAAVAAEGTVQREIRRGYSTQFGALTLAALHPTDPLTGDTNGDSIVLRLSCGSVDVLLTGDATADSEASMLGDPSLKLDADVLKVGHHGSSTSTTNAFLDAVTPADAVISVGADNTYGHPAQDTLERLAAHGTTVYRTDLNGTVTLISDCSTYSISTTGPAPVPPGPVEPPAQAPLPPAPTAPAAIDCSSDRYNCGDFSSCADVMAVFNACPGDPNKLDGDHDGTPCESLCG